MKAIFLLLSMLCALQTYGEDIFQGLDVDGRNRSMIIHLPENYDPGNEYPLIINMHGFLMNIAMQKNYTGMNSLSDAENVIVVYPQGVNERWNSGTFFGISSNVDDVAFIELIIDFMAIKYKVDTRRVYATGYSAGGFMSYKLACDLSERIAAIAPVASSMTTENFNNCNPVYNVPILAFNGTRDPIVPYNGFISVTSIPKVMKLWSEKFNCAPVPSISNIANINPGDASRIEKITYQDCDGSDALVFLKIQNGGHTWPGRPGFQLLGNTNQDIDGNEEIWKFFQNKTINAEADCADPDKLSLIPFDNDEYLFSWENEIAENKYDLFIFNETENQFIENIRGGSVEVKVGLGSDFKWAVRNTCPSGFISWIHGGKIIEEKRSSVIERKLSIYPNPAKTNITVLTTYLKDEKTEITILDVYGVNKIQKTIDSPSYQNLNINIDQLNTGSYFLRLKNDNQIYTTTFYKN